MHFHLTRRALDDLGLPIDEFCRRDASDYVEANEVVRAFVERRRLDPNGQEWTNLPSTSERAFNLHSSRHRGLTWHDVGAGVVWLLGVGWHESGSRDDAYAVLKQRDADGVLMPTEEDYLDLELTFDETIDFVSRVHDEVPALMERAFATPGEEVRGVIAARLSVAVLVEVVVFADEDGSLMEIWVAFEQPPLVGDVPLPRQPEWILTVLAAMVPVEVGVEDLDFSGAFPRQGGTRPNEIVVCWRNH